MASYWPASKYQITNLSRLKKLGSLHCCDIRWRGGDEALWLLCREAPGHTRHRVVRLGWDPKTKTHQVTDVFVDKEWW